ncbi:MULTISPECIES: HIT family protein [Sporosarcina]|uniref:HIT family protein n=1 Tax=Sporosarcina TaxID=1569 RepID=UPI00129A33AA|nr:MULTISPECIES: HIT family protein [Sporosarcina]GKV66978.1 protein hit [Sporosarcina sp. NCCP-2331]GLB57308.1 protein hit [Sporosarcina sp. NCCP-2378]
MTSCIFCNIVEGSIPGEKVYEDEHVIAFMDIMPVTKGHVLLIPKTHRENLYEMTEDEAANLFKAAPRIAAALKEEFQPAGMNLLQNNGSFAGQSVYHFHMHLIPRYDNTDGFQLEFQPKVEQFPTDVLTELAANIKQRLEA